MNARSQYLETLRKEYAGAGERGRSRLLDEAEKRTGLNRKYLIRRLSHGRPARERSGGSGERNPARGKRMSDQCR